MGTHYLVHQTLSQRGHRPGPSPDTDAAKRGGQAVRDKYGREFYRLIGKKGGMAVQRRHGKEHYARIGRLGGEQTKARYGAEHYARIARLRKQPRTPSTKQGMR
jgi:general stress protein YciG